MKQLSIYDLEPALDAVSQTNTEALPQPPASSPQRGNITEIIVTEGSTDQIELLLPMLTTLSKEPRWLALIDPPESALNLWRSQSSQIETNNILRLRSNEKMSGEALAAKALAAGTSHAVVLWSSSFSGEDRSTLEQASIEGESHGIVLRRYR